MIAGIQDCILSAQLLDPITICARVSLHHHLLSLLLPLNLLLQPVLLLLLLLPLFVSDASHNAFVGLRFLFSIFVIFLLFISETLFDRLISLLKQ